MRSALVAAIALVAVAVPGAAVARPTATKPVVISITAVNAKPVGGIKRQTVKKGRRFASSSARTSAPRCTSTATTSRRT